MRSAARLSWLAPVLGLVASAPRAASADGGQCHVVDVEFVPSENLQIVAWIETAAGAYQKTMYITQQTGRFGLGNRPGRFDFNSGPSWPYGRRITTFPVWSHKQGQQFPAVVYQNSPEDPADCATLMNTTGDPAFSNCGENNLSHPFNQSSTEMHFCRPMQASDPGWQTVADTMTCASVAYTDKGRLSTTAKSFYPPRADLVRSADRDSPSVDMYLANDPFDAVSQATPAAGADTHVSWPIPSDLLPGDYVLWIEVAKEFDHNATYSTTAYPSPPGSGPQGIYWYDYGLPYRGQPSILYKVPFTIGTTESIATTMDYAGYGDPDGADGVVRPPDATITTDTPGSGASRLMLKSDGSAMFRVRVDARPEFDYASPGNPAQLVASSVTSSGATLQFVAPGDDGQVGKVTGYEIRYRANTPLTADNFDAGSPVTAMVVPADPGQLQRFEIDGLLPETDYWVGVRAFDDCRNTSELAIVQLTTAAREVGEVDACFVATAAYGSLMANDVELLRHFRDSLLQTTALGELAVETYYTFGPPVAGVVGQSDLLRRTARSVLAPVVEWVRGLSF